MSKIELVFDPSNPLKLKRAHEEDSDDQNESEEDLLNEDVAGNKRSRRVRKGIDATQYKYDSSDEESENQSDSKSKSKEDDSDSDMFASDDDKPSNTEKLKKPKVQLLNIDELEKELELDGKGQQDEEDSSDNSENDEENENIDYYNDLESEHPIKVKSRKEPKLDAFNLRNEQNEGVFDADGNFIRVDKSDNEDEDEWLNDYKRKDIKLAKKAEEARNKLLQDKQSRTQSRTTGDILFSIITYLQPEESPLQALQRLNKNKLKKKGKRYQPTQDELDVEKIRQGKIIEITELTESLIDRGIKEVYEFEKEELMIKYKQETGKQYTSPNKQDTENLGEKVKEDIEESTSLNEDEIKWEFKWIGDDQIHGPYTTHEIQYWKENYFENKVEIRKVGELNFKHIKDFHSFN